MDNQWYRAVFAELHDLTPRPAYKIKVFETIAEVELELDCAWRIRSITSNDTMISVFYLEQPCDQILVPVTDHPKYTATGYTITAVCCSPGTSDYYCAMVRDGTNAGHQLVTTHSTLDQAVLHQDGHHILTHIAQSTTAGNYLVVRTESDKQQVCRWGYDNSWGEERYKEGYSPTLEFSDRRSGRWLYVMTRDENIARTRRDHGYLG